MLLYHFFFFEGVWLRCSYHRSLVCMRPSPPLLSQTDIPVDHGTGGYTPLMIAAVHGHKEMVCGVVCLVVHV